MNTIITFKFHCQLVCKSCGTFIKHCVPTYFVQEEIQFVINNEERCPNCSSDSLDINITSNKFYTIT